MQNAADLGGAQGGAVEVQDGPMPPELAGQGNTDADGTMQNMNAMGRTENKEKRPRRPHRRRSDPEHHKRMQYAIDAVLGQGEFFGRKLSYRDACKAAGDVTLSALHRCVKEAIKNDGKLPMVRSSLVASHDRAKPRGIISVADKSAAQMAARELSASSIPNVLVRGPPLHPFADDEPVMGGSMNKLLSDMQAAISKAAAETAADIATQVATKAATKSATNALFQTFNGKVEEIVQNHTIHIVNRLAAIEEHLGLAPVGGGHEEMRGPGSKGKRPAHPGEIAGSKKPRHG
ncbi:Hypothetical Protein FCC1311_100442 [Hondaea fermentalgiana]|uniref:Uncharacterized protein n=1 Tax=Hondaea fermentalgiana TaxID=2315210 RepID=A0A2R5GZC0_9STRA|nr:Hypothetical Protein FCC1311_100442 [Hondaea fermentalgiana]|eukprot:GBG33821.1 Hypothetical Protein FCC1311_100442 [Hondaea fermentalgiana]